jgi:hypothetical protein
MVAWVCAEAAARRLTSPAEATMIGGAPMTTTATGTGAAIEAGIARVTESGGGVIRATTAADTEISAGVGAVTEVTRTALTTPTADRAVRHGAESVTAGGSEAVAVNAAGEGVSRPLSRREPSPQLLASAAARAAAHMLQCHLMSGLCQ